ncbi:MAG: hypothetical protein ACRD3Q_08670, partial [Terriglobales bacterium]
MRKLLVFLVVCFASAASLSGQMLIFDRGPSSGASQPLGLPKQAGGFLADDFQVGVAQEDWVIDHIRIWAVPDPTAAAPRALGDLYKKFSLYGGIAPDPNSPSEKASAECDCHNLPPLKTAVLEAGSDSTNNPDIKVSRLQDGTEAW